MIVKFEIVTIREAMGKKGQIGSRWNPGTVRKKGRFGELSFYQALNFSVRPVLIKYILVMV